MKGRAWAWLGGAAAVAALAILGIALLRGDKEPASRTSRLKALRAEAPAEAPAAETPREVAVRTLPPMKSGVTRDEIVRLLREAAGAYRARDEKRFDAAMAAVLKNGSPIQRMLAEILLEIDGAEEKICAALALQQVATAEIGPFAVALVQSELADEVKAIAIQILTKFKTPEAAAVLEKLLFAVETAQGLKALMIDYFAAVGGDAAAEVLSRASIDPSLAELRAAAAKGLAKIGTAHAARLLFDAWLKTFDGKQGQALSNYYLLQALATFDPQLLRVIVKEVLKGDASNSTKNVFLSMLGKADRGFALDVVRDVLANEKSVSVRKQAILVLGALGGAEAQEILLDVLAKGAPKEVLEGANALLGQEKMDVAFEKVRGLLASMKEPLLRAVLANVLARYEAELAADPAFVAELLREAEAGMAGEDTPLRGLAVNLSAQLARFAPDPADRLISLYGSLNEKERHAFPVVFSELARQPQDQRVRAMLETALADETLPQPHRLVAADALFASGGADLVYQAIGASKDAHLVGLMSGVTLARGGTDAAKRLGEIAQNTVDAEKRQLLEGQIKAWTYQK